MLEEKYCAFISKHPGFKYANAFISVFSPFTVVFLVILIIGFEEDLGVLVAYALFGSLVLGCGLLSCAVANYNKAFCRRIGIFPIAIGTAIIVGNTLCAQSERIAQVLTEDLLSFQLFCFFGVFWSMLMYYLAREAIEEYIKRKNRLTEKQLDDLKTGFRGRLWYQKIHEEYRIGGLYFLNTAYTVLLALFLIGTIALVFCKMIATIVMPLSLIVTFGAIILQIFVTVIGRKSKKSFYKTNKKGFLRRIPGFYEIAGIVVAVVFVYWQIQFFMGLFVK